MLLLSILLAIVSADLLAQTTTPSSPGGGGLSGKLIDGTTQEPLGFANVVVYTITDSLITGTTTELDGSFSFDNLPLGDFRVEASFIGYATENLDIELNESEKFFALGDVILGTGGQDLEEVIVTADRAVMELGLDRKVFNVKKCRRRRWIRRRPAPAASQRKCRPGRQHLPAWQWQRPLPDQWPPKRPGGQ